jgi:DNA-binding NtrC family response regulator
MSTGDGPSVRVLVVDDDPLSLELVSAALEQPGMEITSTTDPGDALEIVRVKRPDVMIVDLMMPGLSGMEVLEQTRQIDPAVDVILMTAHYSTESAVEAIQKGAADYFNKPIDIERLQRRVGTLAEDVHRRHHARRLDEEMVETLRFEGMVARSPVMLDLFATVRRVAPHFRTALISGPTGAGKELVAKALHNLGSRPKGPFVVCNCAALTETLAESELFGHLRGSFTGAQQDRVGLFEAAHGGTLFLDEIGEMPMAIQAKLLRAVQQQEVLRVGATSPRKVDVRIVAATNRTLKESIANKEFREDLFFRLSMVQLVLPRLADRREDIPLLIQYFLDHWAAEYRKPVEGIDHRAMALLNRHAWPGNVRELENTLGYAVMMAQGSVIMPRDFPEHMLQPEETVPSEPDSGYPMVSLEEMRHIHARRILDLVKDKVQAAAILGVSRATFYRLLTDSSEPSDDPDSAAPARSTVKSKA